MSDTNQERPKRLTAQRKFQIYMETRNPDAPVGEILRRYGLHLADLRKIEATIEGSAIAALKVNAGRQAKARDVTPEEHERVLRELREKEKALADLTVEHQLLKKKDRLGYPDEKKGRKSRKD